MIKKKATPKDGFSIYSAYDLRTSLRFVRFDFHFVKW